MARYYRRRYTRTVVRAPKKKWSTNIHDIDVTTEGSTTVQGGVVPLAVNSILGATPTPVIVKTGNFKIQGDVRVTAGAASQFTSVSLYVIYVPESYPASSAADLQVLISSHPEWIMGWKFLSSNKSTGTSSEDGDTFTFSSRLKRNLNSGDRVILACIATGTNINNVKIEGKAQYWTCSN